MRCWRWTTAGRRALRPAEALAAAGLDGSRRPETLSIAEFARLADIYVPRDELCYSFARKYR